MDVKPEHLQQILTMLTQKTGQHLDRRGLQNIAEEIKGLNGNYLYRNIFRAIEAAKGNKNKTVSLREAPLDMIARYLGFKNTPLLIRHLDTPVDPLLAGCQGSYYCYLRRNSEDAYILRSPVKIESHESKMILTLHGPRRTYTGEITLGNGCLFILMVHEDGKQFHHIYRLGKHDAPEVLQGIFSGVSTVFDPIGGRTVLIRTDEDYKALKNKELELIALEKSKDLKERRLAEYFKKYEHNNLNIRRVNTLRLDDLGVCK